MAKLIISLLIFIYIIIKLNNSNVFVTSSTLPFNRHLNYHRRCPVHHKHPLCNRYNNNNNNNNNNYNNNHVQSFIKTLKKSQKLHDNLPRNIIYYSNDNNDNNNSNNNHHIRHHKHINNHINNNNNNKLNQTHNDDHKNHIDSVVCQKCARANKVHVTEEELTELRIEFVKKQILEKLRLKERPKISVDSLPQPLYQGATILNHRKAEHRHLDDYYARTNQRFIFLEEENEECRGVKQGPSMCFSFNTNDDLDHIDVATAELWAYRQADNNTDPKRMQMYVVSELSQKFSEKYLPKVKPIAINSSGVPEGWIKIDIVWPIKNRILHISCPSCEENSDKALFSTEKFHRPFIVLDTRNRQKQRRQKRSVNCSAGVTECCREKLYISFAEIGWDDWILHPAGYDAYFCRGSCSTAATVAMSNTPHSSILRKYIYHRESNGKPRPLELTPCCTAKQFSSLELLYMDSNRTGTVKTLPNMIIEACGCM